MFFKQLNTLHILLAIQRNECQEGGLRLSTWLLKSATMIS
ncbi:Uncharacterised protein [Burkholderia pseudomallei]|nr:Uncharacterised protein [Burkholderia pseudomallei]